MMVEPALIEIKTTEEEGYHSLIYSAGWRTALLRDAPRFRREHIHTLQRHNTSDELFVLLSGTCTLLVGDGGETSGTIYSIEMAPCRLYNVRRGVWHNCATNAGTVLLIVENADVSPENTDTIFVSLP